MRRSLPALLGAVLLFAANAIHAEDRRLWDGSALTQRVFGTLEARLALMPEVAAAKWLTHQPVGDAARETAVVQSAGDEAERLGLTREPVEALFAVQIAKARSVQSALTDQWAAAGAGPVTARSLRDDLRPRIDQLTHDMLSALALAAPFLATLDADTVSTALPEPRWSADDRRQVLEALRRVRLAKPRSPLRLRRSATLRIGLPADYAPFAWTVEGQVVGADVELTTRLAAALGLTPVFVQTRWSSLLDDLADDHFDIAAGGISVTAARQAQAAFSLPLMTGGKTAIGRCTDRDRFATPDAIDTDAVRVIENHGGTNESFASRHLHHAAIRIHPDNLTVFQEIVAGRADVMYTDDVEVARVSRREPTLCRLLPQIYEPAEKALLLPADANWRQLIDAALEPLLRERAYVGLIEDANAR
jgi:cyclohexadienyl dehydratase